MGRFSVSRQDPAPPGERHDPSWIRKSHWVNVFAKSFLPQGRLVRVAGDGHSVARPKGHATAFLSPNRADDAER
jgi:hypothetical protein